MAVTSFSPPRRGAPTGPDWYHNLKAHPETTIEVGTGTVEVRASEVSGEERDRLFREQAERAPSFAEYAEKARGRTIPVIVLTPGRKLGRAERLAIDRFYLPQGRDRAP